MKIFVLLLLCFSYISCEITLEDLENEKIDVLFLKYCKDGNYRVVSSLLDKGANILATDKQGRTGLHLIALYNNPDSFIIAQLLLLKARQANIPKDEQLGMRDNQGNTPYQLAVRNHSSVPLQVLLFKIVDSNARVFEIF